MPSPFVRPSSGNSCNVTLPDGSSLLLTVNRNLTGAELVNKICEQLDIQERNYFSCTYGKRQKWLNKVKQVRRQVRGKLWLVTFKVKLYPPAWLLDSLSNPMRCHLFSQLTSEVATGKLPCSFDTLSCLGSYVVQSLLGDYDERTHGSGIDYIRQIAFGPNQDDELLDEIAQRHQSPKGRQLVLQQEVRLCYLQEVACMALYGIHLYEAKNSQGESVSVGVNSTGIVFMKGSVRLQHLMWAKIITFGHRFSKFTVKIRPTDQNCSISGLDLNITVFTPHAKHLFTTAVEHHQLFRVRLNKDDHNAYSNVVYRKVYSRIFEMQSDELFSASADDLPPKLCRQQPLQGQCHGCDNIAVYERLQPRPVVRHERNPIYETLIIQTADRSEDIA